MVIELAVRDIEIFEESPYLLVAPVDDWVNSDEVWIALVNVT